MISKFVPFSKRQKTIMSWWTEGSPYKDYNGIIADGSIRAGKSVAMSLSFVFWAMATFNRMNFAFCGVTVGALRRNVVDDMIVTIEHHGYNVQDKKGMGCLIITDPKGEHTNKFYMFSCYDARSQDAIQGITLAGVMFDEVALMPESAVNQATGRCSIDGAKFWFNCNPGERLHWFKVEWINKYVEKELLYVHFTMDDNLSLTDKVKRRYMSMYTGVFYRRYIEGLWVAAEGVIYDCWDETKNGFDANVVKPWEFREAQHYVAIDYGTVNPTVFLDAWDDGVNFWITKEYYHDSKTSRMQKTAAQYAEELERFLEGDHDVQIIVDPSAEAFILELKNRGYWVKDADNSVLEGIRMTSILIAKGAIKVDTSCKMFRKEIETYVWDSKAAERGEEKPVKANDHAMDALRYLVKTKTKRYRLDKLE